MVCGFRSGLLTFFSEDSCWNIFRHQGRGGYVRESLVVLGLDRLAM